MKARNVAIAAVVLAMAAGSANATVLFSTGFEPGDGYVAGQSIHGINGWNNGSGTGQSQTASVANPFQGSQSLHWNNTSLVSFYSVRRALPSYGSNFLDVSIKVFVTGDTQDNRLYGLYLVSSPTGTMGGNVLGLTLGGDGAVRAGKAWSNTYQNTGLLGYADPGTYLDRWLDIRLTFDPNTLIGSATISGFDGPNSSIGATFTDVTAPLGLNVGTDWFSTSDRMGNGYFDNLVIAIPAPGALALLGVAGLFGVRRRR